MEQLQYQLNLLKAQNEKLSETERMYHLICDTSKSAYIYYNFKTHEISTIGNWNHYFDFTLQETKDFTKILDYIKEEDRIPLREVLFLEKQNLKTGNIECSHGTKKQWIEFEVSVEYNEEDMPQNKVIKVIDTTKFKLQKEELEYMAYYDSLTGLYNRNYFAHLLGQWIEKAELHNSIVSAMFIDIDDFRKVNDGLGMIVGDELVQIFGQYLKELCCENVIASHFSSDLFCIAIYEPCGSYSVDSIAKQIHQRVQWPFLLSSKNELFLSVGIGVAEYPEAASNALDLINRAEIVMFRAKSYGKNSIEYFDAPILNDFLDNVSIEHKLKEAIHNQKFTLCFQPQYESADKKLRGVEALIRWNDDGHPISPTLFIPIAEKNGTIIPIGDWVLEESIKTFANWFRKYHYPLILSINISAIQYKRSDFVPKLLTVLEKYEINPQTIELEITESVLIDDFQDVTEKMCQLRELGIRVSLDDFGTGYSSLSYLKGLPIDTLKIDKSFIDTVTSDSSTQIITESIVKMVKQLGFETVAEGVETTEQFNYLKAINCDNIQGFLLGKPMLANEIETLLMKSI